MANLLEKPTSRIGYDDDFSAWALDQAAALRSMHDPRIDWEHIAAELEGMTRSDKREIRSRLKMLLLHLLKWEHQPGRRSLSWRASIVEARSEIAALLTESPSLRPVPGIAVPDAYPFARVHAADEIGIAARSLPETCPYSIDQILDGDFYPGPAEPFPE